jgi:hypothetical protein
MQIKQRELKKKKGGEGKTYSFAYSVMKNKLEQELKRKRGGKYI